MEYCVWNFRAKNECHLIWIKAEIEPKRGQINLT